MALQYPRMASIVTALTLWMVTYTLAQANALRDHPSPYLALHGDDPVAWRPWSEQILEQAQASGKPIFLSSGYFSCHWCHVMQRESFNSPTIARLLNQHFIPVKIDRELNPALDEYLMAFVRKNFGAAGWPLNVFLTPEGYPLTGLSYAPSERFEAILNKIVAGWKEDADNLAYNARLHALSQVLSRPRSAPALTAEALKARFIQQALQLANELQGGIGEGSRFPMAPQYLALVPLAGDDNVAFNDWLRLTLESTAGLGMRDHLNGGFFRYTTDPDQRTPHFEKMLYNQALQARLYLAAARQFDAPDYREVAYHTLDFALNGMAHGSGGFSAAISAIDARHREGAAYLWTQQELASRLTPQERAYAVKRWSLAGPPAFEEGWLPLPGAAADPEWEATTTRKLAEAARGNPHPHDTKRIAAWNGLLLSALSDALDTLQENDPRHPVYRDAAKRLAAFLMEEMWQAGRLHRALTERGPAGAGELGDYVFVAQGLADWRRHAAPDGAKLDRRIDQLIAHAWRHHYGKGGWRPGAQAALPGMKGKPLIEAAPLPSPSATLIELTLQRGSDEQRKLAREAMERARASTLKDPFWHPDYTRILLQTPDNP